MNERVIGIITPSLNTVHPGGINDCNEVKCLSWTEVAGLLVADTTMTSWEFSRYKHKLDSFAA